MSMESKYELVILVVSGDILRWKQRGYKNQFSTPDRVLIGAEGSRRFIITWDSKTFIEMEDAKVRYLVSQAMKEVDKITNDPDPNMMITLRAINADGPVDLVDNIVSGKFDRIIKLLNN